MPGPVPDTTTTVPATAAPHYLRVASSGKIRYYVEFTLKFLRDYPDRPLVLHTLPPNILPPNPPLLGYNDPSVPKKPAKPVADSEGQTAAATDAAPAEAGKAQGSAPNPAPSKSRLAPATTTIPRLISVVEIIQREYLKPPSMALVGLHQYNEVGSLEDVPGYILPNALGGDEMDVEAREEARRKEISDALQGKRHIRIHKTPYMRITLSVKERPELVAAGASYQAPKKRQMSKSGKARLKRRLNKSLIAETGQAQLAEDDQMSTS